MDYKTSLSRLHEMDSRHGKSVYALSDLRTLFPEDSERNLIDTTRRLIEGGAMKRIANGVFVYQYAKSLDADTVERIANTIRRGEYNYLSLESALSEYGVISQIPIGRITVMTTGRKGTFTTPYGTIEFTHTSRPADEIVAKCERSSRPLPVASPELAYEDLCRVRRNLHLVSLDDLEEVSHSCKPNRR